MTRSRLTGLGGGLVSEQVSIDLHGNETRSQTRISSGGTETRIVNAPDSNQDAVTVMVDGRVTSSTSPTGLTTTYGYDGLGRRTSTVDPRTGASETHYDAQGRIDYVQDAAGNQTSFAYDPSTGRKTRETNALGKHSYFAYDARGQLTRTWGDVPYPVQYDYDGYGRRMQMYTYREDAGWSSETWPESAHGDPTRWHYEEATGLLASKEDAAGKAVTYSYGPAGRLATRTWARQKAGGGQLRTNYAYDPATGELIGVDYNDDTPDVAYAYDRLGRQSTVTDAVGTRVFAYSPQSLQLDTETIAGLTPATIKRYYDPVSVKGRLVGIQLGASYTVGYGYDQTGRIGSVSWTANGQSDAATYSRVSRSELLAGYTTQSGFAAAYAYETKRDLKTQVSNSWNGSPVSQHDYRYDAIGRRTSVETAGSAFGPRKFTAWGYDERNQVVSSKRYAGAFTASPNVAHEFSGERRVYGYDPIGNRGSALDQDGVTPLTYAANELNQYEVVGQQAPTYEEDGNLLNDGTKQFTYNAENQLKSVTMPGVSVSTFDYDYLGRRVRKSVDVLDDTGPDYSVTWIYEGWNKIQERSTIGSTATAKSFIWGLDLSQSMEGAGGIGGLVAVVDGSGIASLFAYDGNGNVSELVDANGGGVSAHYEYDAFGNVTLASGSGAAGNCYRFSSKESDDETGLVYYGYRYYSPDTGHWVQRDPVEEMGGINLYGYAGNRVVDRYDILGLELPPFPTDGPSANPREQEDREAYGLLMGAEIASFAVGYSITAKILHNYLFGDGSYELTKSDMLEIVDDARFKGTLAKHSPAFLEEVKCGYQRGDEFFEHTWYKDTSPALWSAFNSVRVHATWAGVVEDHAPVRSFFGSIVVDIDDTFTFSDPEKRARKPFAHVEYLSEKARGITEERFSRLEARGWVHPVIVSGTITDNYKIYVNRTVPAASDDPRVASDPGTAIFRIGL